MPDILLIEDDLSLQQSLLNFFDECGFTTTAAGTRQQALQIMQLIQPRVCVLDLNLPDGSGLDILQDIVDRKLPTRVVVLTAFGPPHLRARFSPQTLVEWLTKPAAPEQLLDAVQQGLSQVPS
jgi:DNA-binding response OmpR family regulator